MDQALRARVDQVHTEDREKQGEAFRALLGATESPVDWAYEVWDELARTLSDGDNRQRSIASQLLCNLAKSDPENRMRRDFEALLGVTRDEKFVTARHCLQSLWKVGLAGPEQRRMVLDGLERRFRESGVEKNGTLIRYDVIQGLAKLYDAVKDDAVREKALELIETEADLKYRKKYAGVWKGK